MKCTKNTYNQKIIVTAIGCLLGITFVLSGCGGGSSSPAATPTTPTTPTATITISGKVTSEDVNPEANVMVKAFYSDTDPTNPFTMTATDGTYSLTVESNKAASVQWSKSGFVSLNSEKAASSVNITDGDQDMLTPTQVEQVIDVALGGSTTPLGNKAWLVVFVTDAMDTEIGGVVITSNADVEVYPECDGADGNSKVTVAPCVSDRPVMYIAYFDAAAEVSVSAVGDTQIAPVRMGEVTFLEFEQ
jgi:hypothetical protein